MKSEHLGIADRKFLITRLVQQAPTNTLIREFFKNADENAALAPVGSGRIEIYPTLIGGVRKITFFNTGVGMSASELKAATEISSSVNKTMSLDGNFGIGAKVSGLAASPEGIRYRSCKNGEVHEVTIGYDVDEETYVRFNTRLPDGSYETVYNVTQSAINDGKTADYDWTEVVLHGHNAEHDTVSEPIGIGTTVDRSFVATSIFRRFKKFAPGVEVRIDVSMTKGGGKDETGRTRQLKTLDEIIERLPRHQIVSDPNTGISVQYIHDPKHGSSGHSLSSRANAATGSTTFCSLVYKGERYDFKTQKVWWSVAPNFGILFGSKVITIEINLPDSLAMPSQYRDFLMWPSDRSPITSDQFSYLVRELMPDWVKEIIRVEAGEGAHDLNDLQSDLQAILDELRVPTTSIRRVTTSKNYGLASEAGGAEEESSSIESEDDENKIISRGPLSKGVSPRASKSKLRIAPEGSTPSKLSKAFERAPDIKILTDPEEINELGLKGRAARFYIDVQTLYVNGLYPIVGRMADDLMNELLDAEDLDQARATTIQAAQRTLAFRVGKLICFALSKRLLEDWTGEQIEAATSPESLSMAADDFRQSIPAARRWVKEHLKAAEVATFI